MAASFFGKILNTPIKTLCSIFVLMSIQDTICDFLTKQLEITGLHHTWVISLQKIILAAALTILVYLVDWISRKIILNAVKVWAERRGNAYASILVERRVFKHIAHIAPALTVKFGTTVLFNHYEPGIQFVQHATDIYIIFAIVFFFQALIIGTKTILLENPDYRDKPIGSYSQLLNIINYFFGALFTVSEISGQSMWALLTAAGALSAIILLVFKDTITGLVASIQISSNDIIRIGDSIEVPKYGADGEVIEITLTTIKVRNGDNTITTIPTSAPITDSFRNWRGMEESGFKRIKRSTNIKITSVSFLTIETIEKIQTLPQPFIDVNNLIEKPAITNLTVYRTYLLQYLKNHPKISVKKPCSVNLLPTTDKGVPIEIYCFTKEKNWPDHENLLSEITEHIIASVEYFDLEIHESPSAIKTPKP
jgi:miniconductance mechanosensitive channel